MMRYAVLVILLLLTSSIRAIQDNQAQEPQLGRLAYIGDDYNLYTFNFATQQRYALTSDASLTRQYQWPTWSNDGRLAYFCCDTRFTPALNAAAFLSADGTNPGRLAWEGELDAVIYAAWSPQNCLEGTLCRELAMLIEDTAQGTLRVDIMRDSTTAAQSRTIATGAPFYFSWRADASQMLFHRYGAVVDVYDIASAQVLQSEERQSSGAFQTASWSPISDEYAYWRDNGVGRADLVIANNRSELVFPYELEGYVAFSWSPDGRYVAFVSAQSGHVQILDVLRGEIVGGVFSQPVLAFFWSPNSQYLAFIQIPSADSQTTQIARQTIGWQEDRVVELQWSLLDISSGEERRLVRFAPNYAMGYLIAYFDQFAASHRIWSPDSRHLTYSAIDGVTRQAVIYTLDVFAPIAQPTRISGGSFAVWAFD